MCMCAFVYTWVQQVCLIIITFLISFVLSDFFDALLD